MASIDNPSVDRMFWDTTVTPPQLKSGLPPTVGGGGAPSDSSSSMYGDGGDGAVTAVTGTLTKDIFATTYHVPAGVTVAAAGFVIRATESITVDTGGVIRALPVSSDAASGADGGTPGPMGGGGGQFDGSEPNVSVPPFSSSVSGHGGNGSSGAGGAGSAAAGDPSAVRGWRALPISLFFQQSQGGYGVSVGGGGGAGDGALFGGGGGGDGGYLFLMAPSIVNNGTIRARGGDGGAGDPAGNCGGGGGGNGGIVVTFGTFTGTNPDVSGGFGGGKGGTGTVGTAGGSGTWVRL